MITTKLNASRQTQTLSKTTRAYADQELEALLDVVNRECRPEVRETRPLSPEIPAQSPTSFATSNRNFPGIAPSIAA